MKKSDSTEELFTILDNQKERIKLLQEEAIESNKSLESYLWKQAKQPLTKKIFPLHDQQSKQTISRIYKLLEAWKTTQMTENVEILEDMGKDLASVDGILDKLNKEINNRKIYGNRPPSRIRNRLKELNQQVKNKKS
jgi:DNA-binding ferritin-like protein (Dps family)